MKQKVVEGDGVEKEEEKEEKEEKEKGTGPGRGREKIDDAGDLADKGGSWQRENTSKQSWSLGSLHADLKNNHCELV